ncbi:hypothetical protein CK203_114353 [Vitis vinifera]|uniref:Uncharacterized protein n=1 Tax=Vitis vinifera TaxID=29760 RepID=A0A438CDM9_VITVI|nr:hypothetical protein CK203_114353 [Vitis vinifera]
MSLFQHIQHVTAAKKNICLRMRMMTVAHNSKGSLVTIWIGGLTPLKPFNVPETNVVQLWMVDEYEKGYLNCITDLSPQFLLLVTTILSTSQAREPKWFAMTIEGSTILFISEVARLNSLKKYFEREYHARASNYDDLLCYQELCRVHNAAEFSTDIGSELEEATRNHSLLDGCHLQPSFRRWYHSIEYHCRGHQTFRRERGISSHEEPFCGTRAQCLGQGDDLVSHGRNTMASVAPRERLE